MRYESRVIHEMAERMYAVAASTEIAAGIIGSAIFGVGGF